MSEVFDALPQELTDLLQPECRGCFMARFNLEQLRNSGGDLTLIIDYINETCGGWRDDKDPHQSLLDTGGEIEFRLSRTIEANCPYAEELAVRD